MNIGLTLQQVTAEKQDNTGLIEAATGRTLSFNELNRLSDSYSHYLVERGVKPGDRVMLMVRPGAEFICLTFALFKIGAPVILIDPGMGYKNLLRCISRVKPKVLIGIPQAVLFSKIFKKVFSAVKLSICCGNSLGLLGEDIRKAGANESKPFDVYMPDKNDLAAIIFTTGSTGPPKGVRYEHDLFAAQREHVKSYYGIKPEDIDQPAFPLFALFSTSLGACAVIPDMDPTKPAQVDPVKFIASIDEYNVTYSFGSPAIWNVVSNYCIENNITLKSVKKVLMAGAPVPGELLSRVKRILPEDAITYTPYGATESLPIVSITGDEILQSTWDRSRIGEGTCVGRPLPGIEIKVIEISDGPIESMNQARELGIREIGEIIVSGNVVTRAYDNNEDETRLAKLHEKCKTGDRLWHRMGDTGYIDEDGRLWFCGRKAHRVITTTGTLFTIPCEAIVNEHKELFRSALVGISDRDNPGKQIPVLVLEKKKNSKITDAELIKEVKEIAAKNSLTADIKHFFVHPSFPVDIRHNAKIFREKLSVWAEKQILRND